MAVGTKPNERLNKEPDEGDVSPNEKKGGPVTGPLPFEVDISDLAEDSRGAITRLSTGEDLLAQNLHEGEPYTNGLMLKVGELEAIMQKKVDGGNNFDEINQEVHQKIREIEAFMDANYSILAAHEDFNQFVRSNLLSDIRKCLKDLKSKTGNVGLIRLQYLIISVKKLYNRFNKQKTPSGSEFPAVGGLADVIKPEDILEVLKSIEEGDMRSAEEGIENLCHSVKAYRGLWRLPDHMKHRFMIEREGSDPFLDWVNRQVENNPEFADLRNSVIKVLELGPGVGNDALQLVHSFPQTDEYHAIEGDPKPASVVIRRLGEIKDSELKIKVDIADFRRRLMQISHEIDSFPKSPKWRLPDNSVRMIFSKSTLHYFRKSEFMTLLSNILTVLHAGNGVLCLALKTPKAATRKDHIMLIPDGDQALKKELERGYLRGIHPTEGVPRAFITTDHLREMMGIVGFDTDNASIEEVEIADYDFKDKKEVFTFVLARPKRLLTTKEVVINAELDEC